MSRILALPTAPTKRKTRHRKLLFCHLRMSLIEEERKVKPIWSAYVSQNGNRLTQPTARGWVEHAQPTWTSTRRVDVPSKALRKEHADSQRFICSLASPALEHKKAQMDRLYHGGRNPCELCRKGCHHGVSTKQPGYQYLSQKSSLAKITKREPHLGNTNDHPDTVQLEIKHSLRQRVAHKQRLKKQA